MFENQELRFWTRTHRVMLGLLCLIVLGLLSGPSARTALTSLFEPDLFANGLVPLIALRASALLIAALAALALALAVPATETRSGAALLAAASTFATLTALYSALRILALTKPYTGLELPVFLATPLPLVAERGLELLWYVSVASGLASVGFVQRRWAVLGAPAIVLATAAQVGLSLQTCTDPRLHPLCALISERAPALQTALPLFSAVTLLFSWALLLVIVTEIIRSIRRVALQGHPRDRTIPRPTPPISTDEPVIGGHHV